MRILLAKSVPGSVAMKDRQLLTWLVVAFLFGWATNASAQNPARVQFSGGAGWLMPSPEAVLIDSSFFPDARFGTFQTLDTRTDFVTYAPDWFGDVVVYITSAHRHHVSNI